MNLLAFDTSTDRLFIALQRDDTVWEWEGAGGAQSSATLIPAIRQLLVQGGLALDALEAIVFGRGPGSFTGLRTACAVAQGLAFGSTGARQGQGLPLLPVDTLLAVAEDARARHGLTQVVAVLDARMNEVYTAAFAWQATPGHPPGQWQAQADWQVTPPEAVEVPAGWTVAGNAQAVYGERLAPQAAHVPALPTARALLRLAPALIAAGEAVAARDALPRYVRDKVAQTTAERAALAQAAGAATR